LDGRALDGYPGNVIQNLAGRLLRSGLRPSAHGPFLDLGPGGLDPRIRTVTRDRLAEAIEAAAWFQPEHIVFHPAFNEWNHSYYLNDWLAISLETWTPIARRCRSLGIGMLFENTHEARPDVLVRLLEALEPEGVGFCFDVGHANAFGRTSIPDWLTTLGNRLAALHLHDNHGQKDDHLALGRGSIDFSYVFRWLKESGPKALTLEPHQEDQVVPAIRTLAGLWPWPLSKD
jgi:sugar phosphate isomerase/epimerase